MQAIWKKSSTFKQSRRRRVSYFQSSWLLNSEWFKKSNPSDTCCNNDSKVNLQYMKIFRHWQLANMSEKRPKAKDSNVKSGSGLDDRFRSVKNPKTTGY